MLLRNLGDAKELFRSIRGSFVGAGITAFSRITPSHLLDPYQIICLRNTLDLPLIRTGSQVFCLEEWVGQPLHGQIVNSSQILAHAWVRDVMAGLPHPRYVLVYQSYPDLDSLAEQEKWHILANPFPIRNQVGSRASFKKMVRDLRLPAVKGDIFPIGLLLKTEYGDWVKDLGSVLVVQLPDISQGGGRGTFFVESAAAYRQVQDRLRAETWRGIPLSSVSINEYVVGTPVSMALCITRHGLLKSRLQRQLIDLPYCTDLSENGIFCGHVWDDRPWPDTVLREAQRQAELMGGYLDRMGYRGIFGIDFVMDESRDRLVPIELNPRYTGAFPMLSLLHMEQQLIPMEAFHMLEFMGVEYRIHVEELNAAYGSPLCGSHLLVFLPSGSKISPWHQLRAGVYQYDNKRGTIFQVKNGIHFKTIAEKNQFVVVDGPPALPNPTGNGTTPNQDPLTRLCRLLFADPVTDHAGRLSFLARGALASILGKDL